MCLSLISQRGYYIPMSPRPLCSRLLSRCRRQALLMLGCSFPPRGVFWGAGVAPSSAGGFYAEISTMATSALCRDPEIKPRSKPRAASAFDPRRRPGLAVPPHRCSFLPRAGIIHQKETEAAAEGPADLREPSASLLTLRGRGNQLHGHLRSAHRAGRRRPAGLRHIGGRSEATVTPLATWEAPRWPVQSGDGFGSRGHHHKSICLAQNPPKWWRSPSLRVCGSEGGKRCLRLMRPSVRTPRFCLSSARIQSPMVAPEWNRDSGSTLGGDTFNLSPWLGRGLLVPPQVSL